LQNITDQQSPVRNLKHRYATATAIANARDIADLCSVSVIGDG
jgi:hypothetical protein